jgi:hypothetical protein
MHYGIDASHGTPVIAICGQSFPERFHRRMKGATGLGLQDCIRYRKTEIGRKEQLAIAICPNIHAARDERYMLDDPDGLIFISQYQKHNPSNFTEHRF